MTLGIGRIPATQRGQRICFWAGVAGKTQILCCALCFNRRGSWRELADRTGAAGQSNATHLRFGVNEWAVKSGTAPRARRGHHLPGEALDDVQTHPGRNTAAATVGFVVDTVGRIQTGPCPPSERPALRTWHGVDPLAEVWSSMIMPMLEAAPRLPRARR